LRAALAACAILAAFVLAGCGSTRTVVKTVPSPPSATGDQRFFGQIRSLVRKGDMYELTFDPAWFLSGVTANAAQAQDQGVSCEPRVCPPVANDNYVVNETTRTYVFLVPPGTRGTVLTGGPTGTPVPVEELAKLVDGTSSLKLFEPLSTGVWILVHVDTVRTFAQQYHP
jgi:hypothetical protein